MLWLRGDRGVYALAPSGWLFTGSITTPALGISGALGIAPTSPRTYVTVETIVAGNGRFNPILQGLGGSLGTYLSIGTNAWQTAGNRERVYMTNNSYDTATATSPGTARVHIMTTSSMTVGDPVPSALDYRINGQTQTLSLRAGSNQINDFTGADFTSVGAAETSSTGVTSDARLAEVIVYDRALTATEKAAAETALKARYAIP